MFYRILPGSGVLTIDLLDHIRNLHSVSTNPDFIAERRVVSSLPFTIRHDGPEIEVPRARNKLIVKVQHLRLRVLERSADSSRIELRHARVVRTGHANLLQRPVSDRSQALLHPIRSVA